VIKNFVEEGIFCLFRFFPNFFLVNFDLSKNQNNSWINLHDFRNHYFIEYLDLLPNRYAILDINDSHYIDGLVFDKRVDCPQYWFINDCIGKYSWGGTKLLSPLDW